MTKYKSIQIISSQSEENSYTHKHFHTHIHTYKYHNEKGRQSPLGYKMTDLVTGLEDKFLLTL